MTATTSWFQHVVIAEAYRRAHQMRACACFQTTADGWCYTGEIESALRLLLPMFSSGREGVTR